MGAERNLPRTRLCICMGVKPPEPQRREGLCPCSHINLDVLEHAKPGCSRPGDEKKSPCFTEHRSRADVEGGTDQIPFLSVLLLGFFSMIWNFFETAFLITVSWCEDPV